MTHRLLAACAAVLLAGCGDAPPETTPPPPPSATPTPEPAPTRAPTEVLLALREARMGDGFVAVAPLVRRADHDRVLALFEPDSKASAVVKHSQLELWAGIRFDGKPVETIVDLRRAAVIWVSHSSSGGWHMTHSALVIEEGEWRIALTTRFDDLLEDFITRPGPRYETPLDAATAYGESIASGDMLQFLGVISLNDRTRAAERPDALDRDNTPIVQNFVAAEVTAQTESIAVATVTVKFGSRRETAPVALSWMPDERSWRVVLKGTPEHIALLGDAKDGGD